MAGLAGEAIGLGTANPVPIGGVTRATTDGTTSGRGCLENFVGFGKEMSSLEPLPRDFASPDDIVTLCATGNVAYPPDYAAAVPPVPGHEVLSWPTPP